MLVLVMVSVQRVLNRNLTRTLSRQTCYPEASSDNLWDFAQMGVDLP